LTTDNENIGIASFGSPRYTEFPNLVCDPTQGFQQTASAWFNTSCYQLPAFGTRGGAGRHAVYSQGLRNWDAAVNKQWPLGETQNDATRCIAEDWIGDSCPRSRTSSAHPAGPHFARHAAPHLGRRSSRTDDGWRPQVRGADHRGIGGSTAEILEAGSLVARRV